MAAPSVGGMIIDCGSCTVRGDACTDCVVTFLTVPVREGVGPPTTYADVSTTDLATGRQVDLDDAERRALDVLAGSGLVPPLRLVRAG